MPVGHIVLHEPGKPIISNILPYVAGILIGSGLIADLRWVIVSGISALILWAVYRVRLLKAKRRDDAKAVADNYHCSQCGYLLRFRTYGLFGRDGSHSRCMGFYCYNCKDFDDATTRASWEQMNAEYERRKTKR